MATRYDSVGLPLAARVVTVALVAVCCSVVVGCGSPAEPAPCGSSAPSVPAAEEQAMDATRFWALIGCLRGTGGDDLMLNVVAGVDEHLAGRPGAYVLAYHRRFVIENHRAYRPDLFEAAVLAGVAGGDDTFTDFRSWLIAQGRDTYEQVLADPDRLAMLTWDDDLDDFALAESLGALGSAAYEAATGAALPDDVPLLELPETADPASGVPPGNPVGAWEPYDEATLQRTFPRLWERFGS